MESRDDLLYLRPISNVHVLDVVSGRGALIKERHYSNNTGRGP